MSDQQDKREFDVIIQGATGFTGTLVAEYLLRQYGASGDLRWALAGRSEQKLREVRQKLGAAANDLELIVADSFDKAALRSLTARTRVVLTTVGPYALYGSDLVEACVDAGTHYCDLAGEVQWIRKMIDTHQQRAKETGAKIVNCCGFDSVPMDIGVWFLQEAAHEKFGSYCKSISMLVKATKGSASGGTLASMMNLIKESREDRGIARILVHPYSLNPQGEREGPDGWDQRTFLLNDLADQWTAPFVMAMINMRIVRRSNALLDYPYGKDFRYNESVLTGGGVGGWLKSATYTVGLGSFLMASSNKVTRKWIVEKMIPKPGEGPDQEERENGFYNLLLIGQLADGRCIRARVKGDRDPGYGSTCKMLSESAVCLAQDSLNVGGGCWTPASAMGPILRKRLVENAGLTFEIE